MSSLIPIESAEDELEYERQQKQVCADNFTQAMILYNKSEVERKEINSKYLQAVQNEANLKNEVEWLRANQQKNAKHHNKIISELAAEVLRKDAMMEHLR
jgi:hypothetical protein